MKAIGNQIQKKAFQLESPMRFIKESKSTFDRNKAFAHKRLNLQTKSLTKPEF